MIKDILEALGYPDSRGELSRLASVCKVPRQTVYRWMERERIPPGYLMYLERLNEPCGECEGLRAELNELRARIKEL